MSRLSAAGKAALGLLYEFAADSRAVSALEYGLIVSMVAVLLVLAITSADVNFDAVGAMFGRMVNKL